MTPAAPPLAAPSLATDTLFLDARSNTHFAPREVPIELIRRAYQLARWGPTANNSVPLRIVVASSGSAREAVIAHAKESNRPKLERAPLLLVVARDERYHEFLPQLSPGSEEVLARLEADPTGRARRAHDNTLIQVGYLILALRAVGLAVRPYGGFDTSGLDEALLADSAWRSEVLLAVGFLGDDDHGAGPRKGRPEWDDAARVL